MKKVLSCWMFSVMVLSGLSACGPYFVLPLGDFWYEMPVEVNLSERFLGAWDAGYPLKVTIHFESHPAHAFTSEGSNPADGDIGALCSPPHGPVRFQLTESEFGCGPREMTATVSIVPAPELTQVECMRLQGDNPVDWSMTDGGMADGGVTSPPREAPSTPHPEWTQTVQVKNLECTLTAPVVFDF